MIGIITCIMYGDVDTCACTWCQPWIKPLNLRIKCKVKQNGRQCTLISSFVLYMYSVWWFFDFHKIVCQKEQNQKINFYGELRIKETDFKFSFIRCNTSIKFNFGCLRDFFRQGNICKNDKSFKMLYQRNIYISYFNLFPSNVRKCFIWRRL